MNPTAVIAEDEAPQRAELRRLLAEVWPELRVIAECEDGLSALEALHIEPPDVAFLDIRMPGLNGLELAHSVSGISRVVFTTAYEEYAIAAFEQGAIDYLLKPIQRERLAFTVKRVRERLATNAPADVLAMLSALQPQLARQVRRERIKWITASIGNSTKVFPIEDVVFFRAQDKYTLVATATDEAHIRMSLKELIDALDSDDFWQIHRSVIVRATAIRSVVRGDDGKLTLQLKASTAELPVSSAFQYRFKSM
jgi:DNA-binding LytR/AlgR family response regulator